MFAPTNYDFGDKSNYEFATKITCANDEARKMFVEAFGHMLNYNHEQAIACFMACTESCLLYTSPSPRDLSTSRMPSSA